MVSQRQIIESSSDCSTESFKYLIVEEFIGGVTVLYFEESLNRFHQ